MTRLQTERLLLREWLDADRAPFARMNADPLVMEHFPATLTRAQSDEAVDRYMGHFAGRGWGYWAVEVPGELAFAGFVGLGVPAFEAPFMPAVEIGWRLDPAAWGRGYATEAARAALAFAFGELRLDEVVSFTVPANLRSRAVMERIGMRHDPAGNFAHPRVPAGHRLSEHVLYRIERPL